MEEAQSVEQPMGRMGFFLLMQLLKDLARIDAASAHVAFQTARRLVSHLDAVPKDQGREA